MLGERGLMPLDPGVVGALHVERLGRPDVRAGERLHHALFQTSTIDALLSGSYEGDVSFAELRARGDFGLGTFDALDGEMIGLDGAFYQVRADGRAYEVDEQMKTPFAVVTFFEPREIRQLAAPMDHAAFRTYLDGVVAGDAATCHAVRVDGHFSYVRRAACPASINPTRLSPRWSSTRRPLSYTTSGAAWWAFASRTTSGGSTWRVTTSTSLPRTVALGDICSSSR